MLFTVSDYDEKPDKVLTGLARVVVFNLNWEQFSVTLARVCLSAKQGNLPNDYDNGS